MNKPWKDIQPPMLRNALPFDILCIVFDCVNESFQVTSYPKGNLIGGYTQSEVALKRCFFAFSLVCQSWYAAAQPYLLRTLSIRFRASPTAETATRSRGLLDVLQWLDTHPDLPAAVRHLRLIMDDSRSSGCDPTLLHTLLRFHNVRAVEFFDLVIDRAQLEAHASMITTAHVAPINLDTLLLAYSAYRSLSANVVQLCIAWFGSVSTLIVRGKSKADLIGGSAVLESLPARLAARTLTVDIPAHSGVGERLHHSPTFGDQGTLRVLCARFAPCVRDPFVHPAANTLEELHLDFTPWLTTYLALLERCLVSDLPLPSMRTSLFSSLLL